MLDRDFDKWNKKKKEIDLKNITRSFNERDVWFLSIGENIGFEQCGKGDDFLRPILVYRKFSKNLFLGIPLTRKKKKTIFYYSFKFKDQNSTAILSQIRLFDTKRFISSYRYGRISKKDYGSIERALFDLLKGSKVDNLKPPTKVGGGP